MRTNRTCALCNSDGEDPHHLLTDCPFSRQVIQFIWAWHNFTGYQCRCSMNKGQQSGSLLAPLELMHLCSVKQSGSFFTVGGTYEKNVTDKSLKPPSEVPIKLPWLPRRKLIFISWRGDQLAQQQQNNVWISDQGLVSSPLLIRFLSLLCAGARCSGQEHSGCWVSPSFGCRGEPSVCLSFVLLSFFVSPPF
jgi:hypothetical protein